MIYRESFTLIRIPLLGRVRKTFGAEGDRLVGNGAILICKNLEKDRSDGMFTGIAPDYPW